jgi:IS605 OrfB family transposase
MIRSSKISNKLANHHKVSQLQLFIGEYHAVMGQVIDLLWDEHHIPQLLPKETTDKVTTWLSARMIQCAGKQASGIVRGVKKKDDARLFMINKLEKEGKPKQARKLEAIRRKNPISKPKIEHIEPELDSRFIEIDLNQGTSFEGYITITSIGNKMKLQMPFNRTKHFNELANSWELKRGLRLSKSNFTFMFDIPDPPRKTGQVMGIDIGKTNNITCSTGFCSTPNKHGHDLNTIMPRLSRKEKGSNGFKKEQSHRTNYINWSVNQLDLTGIGEVKLEKIQHLRKNKNTSRYMSHWTYTAIFDKLDAVCEEQGVLVTRISPTYTSQRCSKCGWIRKSSRKGKQFRCDKCGLHIDADLNAARNIALNLPPISKAKRQLQHNRTGFYWPAVGGVPIVPHVQKTNYVHFSS